MEGVTVSGRRVGCEEKKKRKARAEEGGRRRWRSSTKSSKPRKFTPDYLIAGGAEGMLCSDLCG